MPRKKNMSEILKRKEAEKRLSKSHEFFLIKPGGNDTALLVGIPGEKSERKELNDAVMGIYSNVEQVGFVNPDPIRPELMMAGGEFCGNATRSAAWKVLGGKPGQLEIKTSGVSRLLKAGVTVDGEAFAEMPVYRDAPLIRPDSKNPNSYIVPLEGITHIVDFNPKKIAGLNEEEIKESAFSLIKARRLNNLPASGVIYAEKSVNGEYKITPVVYVRDIDTLFIESACGSGTAALGLALAKRSDASIRDVKVVQPSGSFIKVSTEYSGNKIGYTQIQGPVSKLGQGTLEAMKNFAYAVEKVDDEAQLKKLLVSEKLNDLYRECFSGPPYYEQYSDKQINDIFTEYLSDGKLFVAKAKGSVIGFGASLPLKSVPEIKTIIANRDGIDGDNCWYMADLGVRSEYRSKGIARTLVAERIKAAPDGATILMRTSVNNLASQTLYFSQGFRQIEGAYQFVEQLRTDGKSESDKRLFLAKNK